MCHYVVKRIEMLKKYSGKFLAVEGPNGCGKSFFSKKLAERLKQEGHAVIHTRQIGGTELGQEFRRILVTNDLIGKHNRTATLLALADRLHHLETMIVPALERGDVIVCDRHAPSTYVNQGALECDALCGRTEVYALTEAMSLIFNEPLLKAAQETFFLDISAEIAYGRMMQRSPELRPTDPQTLEKMHQRVAAYREYFSGAAERGEIVHLVDASISAERIEEYIEDYVTHDFKLD